MATPTVPTETELVKTTKSQPHRPKPKPVTKHLNMTGTCCYKGPFIPVSISLCSHVTYETCIHCVAYNKV